MESVPGLAAGALDRLELALSEAVTNAVLHAHGADPDRPVRVVVRSEGDASKRRLVVEVHDQGPGLDPELLNAEATEGLVEHGRGLFLIRSCVDEVGYERGPRTNVLRLTCHLNVDGPDH